MKIRTRQGEANTAAARWEEQYAPHFSQDIYANHRRIGEALHRLGEAPAPDEVDRAIGNGSWTRLKCSECHSEVQTLVEVGGPENYDTLGAYLCRECLARALALLDGEAAPSLAAAIRALPFTPDTKNGARQARMRENAARLVEGLPPQFEEPSS